MILNHYLKKMALAALLVGAGAAHAIPITTSGVWTSIDGNPSGVTNGIGTSEVSWGVPAGNSNAGQSSYIFDGVNPGEATLDGMVFELGDFTHNNFTIFLPSITGADLAINLDFTDEGFDRTFNFSFAHLETPNGENPCAAGGVNPCPDLVTIPDASSTETVSLAGSEYLLMITGFSTDGGLTTVPEFLTLEGQPNTATLYAKLVEIVVEVPEPGMLSLVGLGLLAFGFNQRRRQK